MYCKYLILYHISFSIRPSSISFEQLEAALGVFHTSTNLE